MFRLSVNASQRSHSYTRGSICVYKASGSGFRNLKRPFTTFRVCVFFRPDAGRALSVIYAVFLVLIAAVMSVKEALGESWLTEYTTAVSLYSCQGQVEHCGKIWHERTHDTGWFCDCSTILL